MKEKNKKSRKSFTLSLSREDYDKIYNLYTASYCRSQTEYLRKVLLQEPVVIKYRNQTADDALQIMLHIKKDMESAIRNLHPIDKFSTDTIINTFEDICLRMEQIHKLWSNECKH